MIPDVFRFWGANPQLAAAFWPLMGVLLGGYVIGSVPFGVLVTRALGLGDVRAIGSGNIGTTNVLRTGSKAAAALTLLGDAGKGVAAVVLARWLFGDTAAQVAALGAFLGHLYPVWLGFRGGKGLATFLGIVLALDPASGALTCAVWLVVALATRISSVAALASALAAPLALWIMGLVPTTGLAILLAALVFWRHRANIGRLLRGTEPRIGQ